MTVKLNKNQERAVNEKGSNILVSAAAGSGKTFVLTRRVISRIINERCNIDEFLIVTFTRDAAAEMRSRIVQNLEEELISAMNNNDMALYDHIRNQIMIADNAHISTIDSFCASVIRQNFHRIPLDPGYRNISAPEKAVLKKQAIDEVLEELLPEDEEIHTFYNRYTTKAGDSAVVEMVYGLYDFADNMPYPYKWLEECADKYSAESFEETHWYTLYKEQITELFAKAKESIDEAHRYMINCTLSNAEKLEDAYETLWRSFLKGDYDAFGDVSLGMTKFVKKYEADLLERSAGFAFDHKDDIEFHLKAAQKILKKIQKKEQPAEEYIPEIYEDNRKDIFALVKLTSAFMKRFNDIKIEKQLADFNDIAHFCLDMFRNEDGTTTEIAKEYQSAFREIIIDEYQDSNYLQEELLTALSRSEYGEDNIFMVGDVKQAIYKFRKATPKLFMEKYNSYSKGEKGRLILLSENYRSRPVVINACNAVFEQIMDNEIGEVDYTDEARLYCGFDYPETDEFKVSDSAEVLIYNDSDEDEIPAERKKTPVEYEAAMTAKRIHEMLYEDPLYIYDKNSYRRVMKKDIVILMRAMTNGNVFFKALNSIGIDCVFDRSEPLFASGEVRCITSLLRLIDNPVLDIPLVAVLTSPLYNMSHDDLAQIRLENPGNNLYSVLKEIADNTDDEKNAVKKLFDDLDYYRKFAVNSSLSELLSEIYERTGYFDFVGILPQGGVRQSNLRLFREKAESMEKYNYSDLHNFIEYIDSDLSGDVSESDREGGASSLSGNEDAVRIMTIHKSKGLEFPVVFVSCLGSRKNASDKTKNFIFDRELGIGLKYIDTATRMRYRTVPYEYIVDKYDREENSELMRLLYVAFTRAREKLILTGINSDKKKSSDNALKYKTKLLPYEHRHEKIIPLYWLKSALARNEFIKDANFVVREYHAGDIKMPEDYIKAGSADALHIINNLEDITDNAGYKKYILPDYTYKYDKDTSIPSKITITEIKRRLSSTEDALNYYQYKTIAPGPAFLQDNKAVSPARMGTVYHSIMENIDFKQDYDYDGICELIKRLEGKGIIDAEEKKLINVSKIYNFTKSDLFARIKASHYVFKETPFVMSMPVARFEEYTGSDMDFVVHGIIDLYFEEEDGFVVVDYKTDKVYRSAEELADKYRIQLKIYAEALARNTGRDIRECIIYSFDKDKEVNVKL